MRVVRRGFQFVCNSIYLIHQIDSFSEMAGDWIFLNKLLWRII